LPRFFFSRRSSFDPTIVQVDGAGDGGQIIAAFADSFHCHAVFPFGRSKSVTGAAVDHRDNHCKRRSSRHLRSQHRGICQTCENHIEALGFQNLSQLFWSLHDLQIVLAFGHGASPLGSA